jgi:DNA-binding CsgD family transcriptional regulator
MIWFDWRGSDLSSPVAPPISLRNLVSDLKAVMKEVGEPVDAIIAGPAAFVVLEHALEEPGCYRSFWLRMPPLQYEGSFHELLNRTGWSHEYREHLRMIGRENWDVSNSEADRIAALWADGVAAEMFAAYHAALACGDLRNTLSQISAPVWVTAERAATVAHATEVTSRLPAATMTVWASATTTAQQGPAQREEWERNLGRRLSPSPNELAGTPNAVVALSPRERQILDLVIAGESNPSIAASLRISRKTVERHVHNIYAKSGVKNRVEAANWAREHGVG